MSLCVSIEPLNMPYSLSLKNYILREMMNGSSTSLVFLRPHKVSIPFQMHLKPIEMSGNSIKKSQKPYIYIHKSIWNYKNDFLAEAICSFNSFNKLSTKQGGGCASMNLQTESFRLLKVSAFPAI